MSSSKHDKIIPDNYFEDLKVDKITIEKEVIERAKQNEPDATHAIGCEYARIEHHEKALRWLGTSAALGFKESQLELGHLFAKAGQDEYALEWYLQARRNHLITDPLCIAKILLNQERYNEARQYFQESARVGNNDAQFQLGLLFYNGWCLDRYKNFNSLKNHYINMDKRLAKGWFVKSAKGGNREAACYVGRIYENGEGVRVDKYRALVWYHESKSGGYQPADKCIDRLYKQGYIHIPQAKAATLNKDNPSPSVSPGRLLVMLIFSLGVSLVVMMLLWYVWMLYL